MKKVVKGQELEEKMVEAVDLLCDTVKNTLGPIGSNAIIDHSLFSPFITNDGVTIARNIESDDETINTILELAKEASIKTNDLVGDGTTTTLVLLQSIFKEGLKLIKNGAKPINIKKSLDNSYTYLKEEISKLAWKPSEQELRSIACTSAEDEEIGNLVSEAYFKVLKKEAINLKETDDVKSQLLYKQGYNLVNIDVSSYYFQEKRSIVLEKCYFLLLNTTLNSLEDISFIIEGVLKEKKSLLILAEDYPDYLLNEVLSLYLNDKINIYLVKTPGFGLDKIITLNDLELLTQAHIINDVTNIKWQDLGFIDGNFNINELTIFLPQNEKINRKIKELEITLNKDELTNKRIAMLTNGVVDILVGAKTATERKEKKMRFADAIAAVSVSWDGVVLGSGIPLYQVGKKIKEDNEGLIILKKALVKPLEQIIANAGLNQEIIISKLEANNYKQIYNISTSAWENRENTNIIDPLNVVLASLFNAISIAGMLLTTTSLIINEHVNNLNPNHEYEI